MYKVIKDIPGFVLGSKIDKGFFTDDYLSILIEQGYIQEESSLPKTWEELEEIKGWYVDNLSKICRSISDRLIYNKNVFPTKEEAEACIALAQLCQLRDIYNGQPLSEWCDWNDIDKVKHAILFEGDKIRDYDTYVARETLAFKTEELRDEFINNFRSLIEIAKPLL